MRARGSLRGGAALRPGPLRVALLLGALSLTAAPAAAQDALAAADRAYDDGRLREAAVAYDDAIASGGLDPARLVRAHLRLGVLSALGGELRRTEGHFAAALALDPTGDAPAELSPELRARFEALREARGGRRLSLSIAREEAAIVITVRDAPEGLARTIEAAGGAWRERVEWTGEPIRLEPPPEALPIEAVLLDAHGNRLARAGARTTSAALVEASEPAAPEGVTGGRNLLESPWLWVAVGAILIGIGVAIAVSASGDRYLLQPPVVR